MHRHTLHNFFSGERGMEGGREGGSGLSNFLVCALLLFSIFVVLE